MTATPRRDVLTSIPTHWDAKALIATVGKTVVTSKPEDDGLTIKANVMMVAKIRGKEGCLEEIRRSRGSSKGNAGCFKGNSSNSVTLKHSYKHYQ